MQMITPLPGRPTYRPTRVQRDRVELMVMGGMSRAAIAGVLGIDRPTLETYFADELANGAARKRYEVLRLLLTSARRGNVAAQKKLFDIASRALEARERQQPTLRVVRFTEASER